METKTCINCKKIKATSSFDSGRNQCKDCRKIIHINYNKSQRGKQLRAQWEVDNRDRRNFDLDRDILQILHID